MSGMTNGSLSSRIDDALCGFAADNNCSEAVICMLTEQEEDDEKFEKYLALLRARLANYPRCFNQLSLASNKQGIEYYVIINYDYNTYKWVLALGLEKKDFRVDANRIYLRCAALPMKIIKVLEEKLNGGR